MFNRQRDLTQEFEGYLNQLTINGSVIYPGGLLRRAASIYPKNIALMYQNQEISYEDLYRRAAALSLDLQKRGIKSGDFVCLLFENCLDYYIAYYGIWQTGAVVIPLNTFFAQKELGYVLDDCKPALIISSKELKSRIEAVNNESAIPVITQEDFPEPQGAVELAIPEVPADRLAALLYTSGTTGFPKGVMLSSKNIITNIAQIMASVDLQDTDRLFGVLPLFHSFAQNTCVWTSCFRGLTTIIIPKIDRKNILKGLEKKPTIMIGVPAFFGLLCLMKTAPLDTVRYFVSGGDALPDKIRAAFQMLYRRKICNGYGLSETAPLISVNLDDELGKTTIIGKPAPGIEVRFVDDEGNELPLGQIGMIQFKGDNIMLGYYNAPEITAKALADGWFSSGDMGYMNEKGQLVLSGRQKDLIISKGFNIYPQEIENVLMTHPLVFRAGVVGKPDDDAGELPIAFVAVREKADDIEKDLKRLCRENLAVYKMPKQFFILSDLPVTATQKVNKPKLKELYL